MKRNDIEQKLKDANIATFDPRENDASLLGVGIVAEEGVLTLTHKSEVNHLYGAHCAQDEFELFFLLNDGEERTEWFGGIKDAIKYLKSSKTVHLAPVT